jgi:DNA-directed RNA polymerase subunit beta'
MPAVISEIDGVVEVGGLVRGLRKLIVKNERGGEKEYFIPKGAHLSIAEGERVKAGTALMDGAVNPHDILKVLGEKELAEYLLREVQAVYRLQGVNINDKHIEIIIRQMLRWVKVEEVGDTEFLVDEQIDKFVFQAENEKVMQQGGKPAKARPLLLGITKSALSTESFISAASFQETTRVLTEASLYGKVDHLRRLKENIIMGRLIPAGTGYKFYRNVELKAEEEKEAEKELDLQLQSKNFL